MSTSDSSSTPGEAQRMKDEAAMEKHRSKLRRAYFLWENGGRPWGRDQEFWDEASRQIEEEEALLGTASLERDD